MGSTSRLCGTKMLIFGLSKFNTGSKQLPLRGNPAGNQMHLEILDDGTIP